MSTIESKIAKLIEGKTVQLSSDEIKYLLDETVAEKIVITNPVYTNEVETDWLFDVKCTFDLRQERIKIMSYNDRHNCQTTGNRPYETIESDSGPSIGCITTILALFAIIIYYFVWVVQ